MPTLDATDALGIQQWCDTAEARIVEAASLEELKTVKIAIFGDKSALTLANRSIKDLPAHDRAAAGQNLGAARKRLNAVFTERQQVLESENEARVLAQEAVDVTLPSDRFPVGARHPLSTLVDQIEDFFLNLGWDVDTGPEVEHEWFNFDSLNFNPDHPARQMQDTFYIDGRSFGADSAAAGNLVMRTHTSPVQSRAMLERGVPIYMACPGKVFRSDALDATHTPVFHQVEGLAVDIDLTMADLKGVLDRLARHLFGSEVKTRLRPSFFPFTEPSAELDFWFPQKKGGPGWIEWGGCGMVNPNVLIANGVDPEVYTGFAFGMGLERTLMLQHGIADMRDIVEGDMRFSQQFGLFGKGA
ncbi:phenylalanine--tRNA ligase subunit alpha [Actinomycetaceae bacterium WB03_NA08]|uniref:Phenylalanine--tRNA ligase alpha subunit n=1 Tax=Scrofimicrobium canadense TaxID=2652290 RepID=A0A6N7WA97_9ACTO|nr:phenylalanine--tRNA ligase subunit alpha [Scrofimicrobium canadense]MSS85058.1 phenylalanine--tRNA ligase subunit alpha [Scrofimicrobium canadense]